MARDTDILAAYLIACRVLLYDVLFPNAAEGIAMRRTQFCCRLHLKPVPQDMLFSNTSTSA